MSTAISIIIAVFIFGLIIIVHELGHFMAARLNDIKVLEFAIGMGPAIYKKQKGDTLYSIRVFPIGGYCKMLGEDESNDDPRAYNNKKVWQRFIVSISGALMNFLLAFVISLIMVFTGGYTGTEIVSVVPGAPAEAAGLQAGDRIININGFSTKSYNDLSFAINIENGASLDVTVKRGNEKITKAITPYYNEATETYHIGIVPVSKAGVFETNVDPSYYSRAGVFESVSAGYYNMLSYIKTTVSSLTRLVTFRLGVENLSGPVGVASYIGNTIDEVTAAEGTGAQHANRIFEFAIFLCALMSANIGVFNLLPLPALDGGRCIFLIVEAIRRKPVDPNKEGLVHMIGFVALMVLAVVVMFGDVLKIFG